MVSESKADSNIGFHQRDHDLLSFMSLFVVKHAKADASLSLLSVLLDDTVIDIPPPASEGAYFSVCITGSREILNARFMSDSLDKTTRNSLPELVALKTPIVRGDMNNPRNRKIWSSMAMELQILKNAFIASHQNVVSLLGVCWKSVGSESLMPAFILESAEVDLERFMDVPREITQRKILGLAIDITAGIRAIHDVGIIHGDIKPKNVLIFKHPELEFTAKIADFGSSLLRSEVKTKIHLPFGTGFWQSPECRDPLDGDQLTKADMFSLGLVLWKLLSCNTMMQILESTDAPPLTESFEELKSSGKLPRLVYDSLKMMHIHILGGKNARKRNDESSGQAEHLERPEEEDSKEDRGYRSINGIADDLATVIALILIEPQKRLDAKALLENLRMILSQVMYRQVLQPLHEGKSGDMASQPLDLNPQERDIWLSPTLKEPTKRDLERIWMFAKSTEWLDQSFERIRQNRSLQNPGSSFGNISEEEASHCIKETLERWRQQNSPKPEHEHTVRDEGAVLEADRSFGTLRYLPPRVINHILSELKAVASDPQQRTHRGAEASWQYALFCIRSMQITPKNQDLIHTSLGLMFRSARLGHIQAQSIVGHLYSTFNHPFPHKFDEVELEWLSAGMCNGSQTARRRLLTVDVQRYSETLERLRSRFAGIGEETPSSYYDKEGFPDLYYFRVLDKSPSELDYGQVLLICSISNRLELVRQMTSSGVVNINWQNPWSESALLCACRAGHFDIAMHLLEHGADPSLSSQENLTPLHFLSSFDDQHIPLVAARLLRAKAPLDARSTTGDMYMKSIDSTFGLVNGTPLTWAVAANNIIATQTLLEHGADPFDVVGRTAKYTTDFGNCRHISPIWLATVNHQYYLLELLLKSVDKASLKRILNENNHALGVTGIIDPFSIIGQSVIYATWGLIPRILLHGNQHELAFQKTFEILVNYGADPLNVDVNRNTVFRYAAQLTQPFVIEFLMKWRKGYLKPSPTEWMHSLLIAGSCQDIVGFETILHFSQAEQIDGSIWLKYFASVQGLLDDVLYLEPLRCYRDPEIDYCSHFCAALMGGKYQVARWFYETGKCDLTQNVVNKKTILGSLLVRSKAYTNAQQQLEEFLKIGDLPDAIFYNVLNIKASFFTALHAAVIFQRYRKGSIAATKALSMIINEKDDSDFLNAQISDGPYKGKTAMHIAAECANLPAVRCLLNEEKDSLDLTLLDVEGNSILDLAAWELRNQKAQMDFWEVPKEHRWHADLAHWNSTFDIILLLQQHGARTRRIKLAVSRIEENDVNVFLFNQVMMPIHIDISSIKSGLPPHLQDNWFWPRVAKLEVNDTFFMYDPETLTPEQQLGGIEYEMVEVTDQMEELSDASLQLQNMTL